MSDVLLDWVDSLVNSASASEDFDDDNIGGLWNAVSEGDLIQAVSNDFNDTTASLTINGAADGASSSYCKIPDEIFENFTAAEFANTDTIRWMHYFPPRHGHTRDVLNLMVGTEVQQQDYVRGLFASATALLMFFFAWGALLLIFRLCAPSHSGNATRWLGGLPLRMPSPPMGKNKRDRHFDATKGDSLEYKEWKRELQAAKRQLLGFRIVVWVAGLSIAIAALVMSVYGVDSLTNTLEAGRESIGIAKTLAGEARSIVDSVLVQNQDLSSQMLGMLEDVNGMCPLVRDPLCDDIYDVSTCSIEAVLGSDLNEVFQTAAGHFVEGEESEYFAEMVHAKNGLEGVELVAKDLDFSAEQLNWALSLSMILSLLLAMLCVLILCGLVCPDVPKVLRVVRSKVMIPTFCVLVFFAYFFSLVFVTASIATADVCVHKSAEDNIDERLMALLNRSKIVGDLLGDNQNLVVEFIGFYVHQCPVEMLPREILEQLAYVQTGFPVLERFGSIVSESTDKIRGVCGFSQNQTETIVGVADALQDQLCSVADILSQIRDFAQCGNWYPLYETTVYEALCYDGTKGFAYVASTQFVIVFMAFVVLTFRVAFWDVQVGDEFYNFVDDDSSQHSPSQAHTEENLVPEAAAADHHHRGTSYYQSLRDKLSVRKKKPQHSLSDICSVMEEHVQNRNGASHDAAAGRWPLESMASIDRTATATTMSSLPHQPSSPRNSIYPSRRLVSSPISPSSVAKSRNNDHDLEARDMGIEVALDDFSSAYAGSEINEGGGGGSSDDIFRHRSVDATSLWMMQHQDNIDYNTTDDDDYENYRDRYENPNDDSRNDSYESHYYPNQHDESYDESYNTSYETYDNDRNTSYNDYSYGDDLSSSTGGDAGDYYPNEDWYSRGT